jgi:hypothetical protein
MFKTFNENKDSELDTGTAKACFYIKDLMRSWLKDCIEE